MTLSHVSPLLLPICKDFTTAQRIFGVTSTCVAGPQVLGHHHSGRQSEIAFTADSILSLKSKQVLSFRIRHHVSFKNCDMQNRF